MPLADFHRSDPFTLGIELELQVVNPPGYDLSQDASTLIADVQHELTVGEAKHDITESMLEIATVPASCSAPARPATPNLKWRTYCAIRR